MGGMRGLLAGLTALALLVACGTERRPSARDDDDMPEISAAQLDDAFEDPATADFLAPEERTALDRVQATRSCACCPSDRRRALVAELFHSREGEGAYAEPRRPAADAPVAASSAASSSAIVLRLRP